MITRSTVARAAFGAAVAAALGVGASAATATSAEVSTLVYCPGYVNSAQICTDCCWDSYGTPGSWNSRTRYCTCAL